MEKDIHEKNHEGIHTDLNRLDTIQLESFDEDDDDDDIESNENEMDEDEEELV